MSLFADLSGPSLPPASGGPARQLVVLLHGYGADGNDLIPLGAAWRQMLPDAAFLAPDAPFPCDANPFGRQWFPLTLRDPAEIPPGLAIASPILDAFLDNALADYGLDNSALALAGFSQGAMMALDVGLRRPGPIAGIVSFSGYLANPPEARDAPYPPVLLAHGSEDPLITASAMALAERALLAAGVGVEAHLRRGLGHGIDEAEIGLAAQFLAAAFAV